MALFRALVMALAVAALAPAHLVQAQDFPTQRVTIVVPFGAGSVTDISARIVADEMAKRWGQQVIVENRPGLAGTVDVAKAAADGYTLMLTSIQASRSPEKIFVIILMFPGALARCNPCKTGGGRAYGLTWQLVHSSFRTPA
jgi:tripartite-type tricarboxylate transporter receptor subunit TctC